MTMNIIYSLWDQRQLINEITYEYGDFQSSQVFDDIFFDLNILSYLIAIFS